ncbi:capsid portal protein, partial [Escherichia coli]|nr:capsid portal protein [Escherichia coli]
MMSEHDTLSSTAPVQEAEQQKHTTHAEAFSFGDPIPVLDRRELLDYVDCVQMDRWFETRESFADLARTY